MDLILWRHAEAEDGTPDAERKLTAKGQKQAQRMAKWLRLHLPPETVIIASPARRALQTARALEAEPKVVAGVGTSASPQSLLAAIHWPRLRQNLVVVGHQPTLGATAALLLTGETQPWSLKKGGLIWLSCQHNGSARIQLRAAISPDLL